MIETSVLVQIFRLLRMKKTNALLGWMARVYFLKIRTRSARASRNNYYNRILANCILLDILVESSKNICRFCEHKRPPFLFFSENHKVVTMRKIIKATKIACLSYPFEPSVSRILLFAVDHSEDLDGATLPHDPSESFHKISQPGKAQN